MRNPALLDSILRKALMTVFSERTRELMREREAKSQRTRTLVPPDRATMIEVTFDNGERVLLLSPTVETEQHP